MSRRVLVFWSSGKDSAWAVQVLQETPGVEIAGLLTTVHRALMRVPMHGTRLEVLQAQARALGLPLQVVPLPYPCSNPAYEAAVGAAIAQARERGVTHVAFGDLFLEDLREYRSKLLERSGIEPLFPLWGEPTSQLARKMHDAGLEAIITSVDARKLPSWLVGRKWDPAILEELPVKIDPCGENGEFHTCVVAGPMFRERLRVRVGEVVEHDGFCLGDVFLERPPGTVAGPGCQLKGARGLFGSEAQAWLLYRDHPRG